MKYFNRIFLLTIITIFSVVPVHSTSSQERQLTAEEQSEIDAVAQNIDSRIWNVYVKNITLEKTTYSPGETVTGNFLIENESDFNASSIYYSVSLVGEYQENTLANRVHSTSVNKDEKIFVVSGGAKQIPFSFKLPKNVTGDGLGIQVQVFSDKDLPLGWGDALMNIVGEITVVPVEITDARIVFGTNTYFTLDSGPTIQKDTEGSVLSVDLLQESGETVTVTPVMTVYDRAIGNNELYEESLDTIELQSGVSSRNQFELPTFEFKGGVYEGKIIFLDKNEEVVTSEINFRYLVNGDSTAGINNISANIGDDLGIGSVVKLDFDVYGPTFDIITGDFNGSQDLSETTVKVKLLNEDGETVGEGTSVQNLITTANFSMEVELMEDVDSLSAEAELSVDGVVLDTFSGVIFEKKTEDPNMLMYLLYAIAIVILIIIIVLLSSKSKKITPPVAIVLVTLLASGVFITNAQARDVLQDNNDFRDIAGVHYGGSNTVGNPAGNFNFNDIGTVEAGEEFYITGAGSASACRNGYALLGFWTRDSWDPQFTGSLDVLVARDLPETVLAYELEDIITPPTGEWTYRQIFQFGAEYQSGNDYSQGINSFDDWGLDGRSHWYARGYRYSVGPIVAAPTEGEHFVDVYLRPCINTNHSLCASHIHRLYYTSEISDACSNLDGEQDEIPYPYTDPEADGTCTVPLEVSCQVIGSSRSDNPLTGNPAIGEPFRWKASPASSATVPLTYTWSGDAQNSPTGSQRYANGVFNSAGSYTATVSVTQDIEGGQTQTVQCPVVIVEDRLGVSCNISKTSIIAVGQSIDVVATPHNATGDVRYEWGGIAVGTGPGADFLIQNPGSYSATIRVTDGAGRVADDTCNIVVGNNTGDLCPNIDLVQTNLPAGYTIDGDGNCVTGDGICPNVNLPLNNLPAGYTIDGDGNCIPGSFEEPKDDLCLNISGIQLTVPTGYVRNSDGNCLPGGGLDICPNIDGDQTTVPAGLIVDGEGNCVSDPGDSDLCRNLPGIQTTVPTGYTGTNRICLPNGGRNTDRCPNINGQQATVPPGYYFDYTTNICRAITILNDKCPNLANVQTTIPAGYYLDENNNCSLIGGNPPRTGFNNEEITEF